MNRLKPTPRYQTRDQILRAIDRTQANKEKWAARADAHDRSADTIYAQSAKEESASVRFQLVQDAEDHRSEARRIRSYQCRYVQRLKRLKKTLAAFLTQPMPFVEESVVMQ